MNYNLYEAFLKYSYNDFQEMFKLAKNDKEKDFYMTLANLKLQMKQKKLLKIEEINKKL
ncbi:hypothetical protein PTK51_15375 [Clostridium perfringens]|nr:hypothetical protein [Clostridium perfringens]